MSHETIIDVEKRLRFAFDELWFAVKWDDHAAYRDGLAKQPGTSAVDILATDGMNRFWFIEVKDPRGFRIGFRPTRQVIHEIIADKVRDTIAAIVWSKGRIDEACVDRLLGCFCSSRGKDTFVVLWLEDADYASAAAIKEHVARELRWLNPKVIVTNRSLISKTGISGLAVNSLPSS